MHYPLASDRIFHPLLASTTYFGTSGKPNGRLSGPLSRQWCCQRWSLRCLRRHWSQALEFAFDVALFLSTSDVLTLQDIFYLLKFDCIDSHSIHPFLNLNRKCLKVQKIRFLKGILEASDRSESARKLLNFCQFCIIL